MKKLFTLLLALLFAVAPLTGCGAESVPPAADGGSGVNTGLDESADEPAAQPPADETPALPWDEADYPAVTGTETIVSGETAIDEEGWYSGKEEVTLYLLTYGQLPQNFITKKDAKELGWPGGSLEPYAPGMSIGGDRFGNYEGALPEADGRHYTECDIDTQGAEKRGAKRMIFSNDGLIFYTEDHYKTFTLLMGEV